MKEGIVLKAGKEPGAEELKKINRYTRREFRADELYTFSVALCDNEIDRDGERFSVAALEKLAELFLGKTGIFNHSAQAQNQTARIYDCRVERDEARKTSYGEPYCRVVAQAYLPDSEKNRDFILELESGIKKEVSVGCSVARVTCSVCGADLKRDRCRHEKGTAYGGKLCCAVLDDPTDAYEWSFVAVPAQREAGVIKSFCAEGAAVETEWKLEKELGNGEVTLTKEQGGALLERLQTLEADADCGRAWRAELENSLIRCALVAQPGLSPEVLRRAARGMSIADLKCFEKSYRERAEGLLPLSPQLVPERKTERTGGNAPFKI